MQGHSLLLKKCFTSSTFLLYCNWHFTCNITVAQKIFSGAIGEGGFNGGWYSPGRGRQVADDLPT